ncbi:hypothetical protein, partial [Pseudomonas syringae]|uniref:hypothetical protein n=1 Tax=Pseudomonas syringae TaxID=317 RepID=UPI00195671A8
TQSVQNGIPTRSMGTIEVGRTLSSYPDLFLILAEGRRSEPGDASLVREGAAAGHYRHTRICF